MNIKGVKRPIFRLSQPGQDTTWTTRPYHEAIRMKKLQASPAPLPTELPEKIDDPEQGENDPVYRELIKQKLSEVTGAPFVPDQSNGLEQLSDDDLQEFVESTPNDSELEAADLEMDRRGWKRRALGD